MAKSRSWAKYASSADPSVRFFTSASCAFSLALVSPPNTGAASPSGIDIIGIPLLAPAAIAPPSSILCKNDCERLCGTTGFSLRLRISSISFIFDFERSASSPFRRMSRFSFASVDANGTTFMNAAPALVCTSGSSPVSATIVSRCRSMTP